MDYVPPPELRPQFEFVTRAKREYKWSPGAFAPVFRIKDLLAMEDQTEPQGDSCLRQLKERGLCQLDVKSSNDDPTSISIDRNCIVMERGGKLPGTIALPVVPEAARLLPPPEKTAAPPLTCPPKADDKPQQSGQMYWQDKAGVRHALAPALPVLRYKI